MGVRNVLNEPSFARWLGNLNIKNLRVVVKIMVPFGVPSIIRHLLFEVPKKGP